jgi:hypothetical protein
MPESRSSMRKPSGRHLPDRATATMPTRTDTAISVDSEVDLIEAQPVVMVEVAALVVAGSPRLSGEESEHIEALSAVEDELPPIVVHRSSMRVVDGAHRVRVAQRRGETSIAARFFDGTDADAFVLAVRLNLAHGLPLPMADRKCAAERIIATHPHFSDRRVASLAGISPATVAHLRRGGAAAVRGAGSPGEGSRMGRDGRFRPLDGTAGRRLAGQLISENPCLSLRQVAKAAAISPETVRDVRNRLRNGEDPVPRRRAADAVTRTGVPAVPRREVAELAPARPRREQTLDLVAVVERLKVDPSLRYSDMGRNLLRMLSLHTLWTGEWESIVTNLPPHCRPVVSDLAREFAVLWADFAAQASRGVAAAS